MVFFCRYWQRRLHNIDETVDHFRIKLSVRTSLDFLYRFWYSHCAVIRAIIGHSIKSISHSYDSGSEGYIFTEYHLGQSTTTVVVMVMLNHVNYVDTYQSR